MAGEPDPETTGAWQLWGLFLPRLTPGWCRAPSCAAAAADADDEDADATTQTLVRDVFDDATLKPGALSQAAPASVAAAKKDLLSCDAACTVPSAVLRPGNDGGSTGAVGASPGSESKASSGIRRSPPQGNEGPAKTKAKSKPKAGRKQAAKDECPGARVANKVSYLQKVREERQRQDEMAKELAPFINCSRKKGGSVPIQMPSPSERKSSRSKLLGPLREQYRKLAKLPKKSDTPALLSETTDQYSIAEAQGLTIKDGHQHMPRPKAVDLPKDFRKKVGEMPLTTLQSYSCASKRILVSVYGDIFDVSDRPDKYGESGPYARLSGHDLTGGFLSGKDTEEQLDQLYDIWKVAPAGLRDKKLQGLLAWVAFYEYEYGAPVGRLKEYQKEAGLKGPPMEDSEDCCIM